MSLRPARRDRESGVRILHIDTGAGWRGGQQQVLWLLQGLRERGHEQLLLAPENSPLAARVRRDGLPVEELVLPALSLGNVGMVRRLSAGHDILHAHDSHAHSLAALATVGGPSRPLVVSRRVAFPVGALGLPKYAAADAYIAVSEHVRQELLEAKVPARKIRVVYDGVKVPDCGARSEERAEFRRKHGIDDRTFLLGTLTSLAPEKMVEVEVDLLAELPASVHLWLARPAAARTARTETARTEKTEAAVQEYARARGLERRFRIFPLDDGAGAFLASLDVFIYLSESEGLGSAILLAMAHGLPVVANRVGGIPEIVRHQETGLLVSPDPRKDLADAVRLLLDSADLRQRLGAAARQFVLAHATSDIMVAKTAAVYEELLQGSRPSNE